MTERYLLFDSGCSVCAALAREVETRSGGRLGVRGIGIWLWLLLIPLGLISAPVRSIPAIFSSPPQPQWWGTVTASYIAVAYWTGIEPHYGAFFPGRWGHNQHDLGPGGDAATCGSSAGCISNWNWWGADQNVLLLPKWGWLWTEPPGGPKWQPANYQARVWID